MSMSMIFCGQCGYQLSPGDRICPRCGAETEADQLEQDPGTYNPTEISHAVIDPASARFPAQPSRGNLPPRQPQVEPMGPLVLGSASPNDQLANETTTMMNSQMYAPQGASYPGYPQQAATGMYGYNQGGYQQPYQPYQAGQGAAAAEILESSHKGKITSLLLILFGLLLLIAAIIIFLLNQQGIIFGS